MNLDDFRSMRRGLPIAALHSDDAKLLQPVERYNGKKQRALLLLHGFSSTPAVFRDMLNDLSYYDAIVVPALPGHADTLDAFATVTAANLFAYCEQLCAKLVQDYQAVDVVGLSLGGLLATHLAQRFKLHHLYLLAPAFDLHMAIDRMITLARCLNWLGFRRLRSAAGNLLTSHNSEIAYRQLPLSTIVELLTLIKQFPFSQPTCPTDLFLGCHDGVVASTNVAARFTNDNITIHWLPNSAHVLPLDGDTATIVACIINNK